VLNTIFKYFARPTALMVPRRRGLELSTLDSSLRQYLEVNPQLLERRRHYSLIRVLEFLKSDLGLGSVDDLLKCDVRSLAISLQKWVNKRVQETSIKTIRFEAYLARSFFSFYDVEIPAKKVRMPRKAVRSRVDRIPSLAEIQKLVIGTRSLRMGLMIMMLALTGMRLGECLRVRREHVDLGRGVIVIPPENSKTGRGREVPIPSELKTLLELYFEKYFPHERGYIFCVENNPEKPMPTNRFYELYHSLLARLGLNQKTPDGSAYVLHPHVFRKWYRTTLESAGVNKLLIDLWIGHNSGVEKLYYLPPPETIRQEFEKADRALTLFGNAQQPAELKNMREEIRFLWDTLASVLQVVSSESPSLARKLARLGVSCGMADDPVNGSYVFAVVDPRFPSRLRPQVRHDF